MNILFLDIDGVLNTYEEFDELPNTYSDFSKEKAQELQNRYPKQKIISALESICSQKVKILNKVLEKYNPYIVVSSTWRKHFAIDVLDQILCLRGLSKTIASYTPIITENKAWLGSSEGHRGKEIQLWLENFRLQLKDCNICILEDSMSVAPYEKYCVRTNSMKGLMESHIPTICNLFENDKII